MARIKVIELIIVLLVSVGLNIPLGMWRARTKKYSLSWFISIHLAVPLIYLLRVSTGLAYWTIPIFVASSLFGQLTGAFIIKKYFKTKPSVCEQTVCDQNW